MLANIVGLLQYLCGENYDIYMCVYLHLLKMPMSKVNQITLLFSIAFDRHLYRNLINPTVLQVESEIKASFSVTCFKMRMDFTIR